MEVQDIQDNVQEVFVYIDESKGRTNGASELDLTNKASNKTSVSPSSDLRLARLVSVHLPEKKNAFLFIIKEKKIQSISSIEIS